MYLYRPAMRRDILDYIYETEEYWKDGENKVIDPDKIDREELYDRLWIADSVTGNASGSYTCNSWMAQEMVRDNIDLVREMADDFGYTHGEIGEKILDEEWEWLDVSIRCYLLGEVLDDVLEEIGAE